MVQSQAFSDMTIAGLAQAGDVGVETVRYYQRRGLLRTPERASGDGRQGGAIRRYGDEDVRRLCFIRSAQSAGFTLDQIHELMELDATEDRERARSLALDRIAALDAKMAEMKSARDSLATLADECGGGRRGPCPILSAFDQ